MDDLDLNQQLYGFDQCADMSFQTIPRTNPLDGFEQIVGLSPQVAPQAQPLIQYVALPKPPMVDANTQTDITTYTTDAVCGVCRKTYTRSILGLRQDGKERSVCKTGRVYDVSTRPKIRGRYKKHKGQRTVAAPSTIVVSSSADYTSHQLTAVPTTTTTTAVNAIVVTMHEPQPPQKRSVDDEHDEADQPAKKKAKSDERGEGDKDVQRVDNDEETESETKSENGENSPPTDQKTELLVGQTKVSFFNAWMTLSYVDARYTMPARELLSQLFDKIDREGDDSVRMAFKDFTTREPSEVANWGKSVIIEAVYVQPAGTFTQVLTLPEAWDIDQDQVKALFKRRYRHSKVKRLQRLYDALDQAKRTDQLMIE